MRSILPKMFLLIAILFAFTFVQAQNFVFEENAQTKGFQILSSDKGSIKISHSIDQFQLEDIEIEGQMMKQLEYGLSIIPATEGAPDVRGVARYLLIPNGAEVQFNITHKDAIIYKDIEIAPAARIPFDTEEAQPAVKGSQYQKNAFFPANIANIETTEVRGMHMAVLNLNPFQYNPVSKELVVYKNLEVDVQISGGNGQYGENRFRSRYWDQILDDLVLNESDIPQMDYHYIKNNNKDAEGCEYLIIVPDNPDLQVWADSIKLFRNEQGITTKVMTISEIGGNTVDNIKSFFNTVYETWDPVPSGVLLMADYGTGTDGITSKSYPHPYSGTFITDNYYADYTGNDLPDFVFARMTGRNYAEMETMVTKFLEYERTPPTNFDFYNKPITALGWQTERWFQICSETVGGYMANVLGKEPVRINAVYGGNPNTDPWSTATNTAQVLNYFGPNGQSYIPATPAELGGFSGGTATDVVNALNDGAFILQHRDHGAESGWGEPAFSMSHINQLNNVGELSHIFSINCLTGRFDVAGECFAEKFHRHTNGGALSLTAATQVSYSFVNDAFVWGMYDNMWPDFLPDYGGNLIEEREFRPAFGSASGKYFLSYSNWPYNTGDKQITYRLFHHHGDAFNIVYTEVPEEMDINYSEVMISGPDFIEIQAEEGALIAFSVDGVLIGSDIASGSSQSVTIEPQIPGTIIKVVITKQNYFRHEGYIQVIAPDGPYVVKSGFEIMDETGNNNHLVDFGETISLNFGVKNLGTEMASNVSVTISSEDPYITINDNEEAYGDIEVDETVMHDDAFSFSVNDSIPDNHSIQFSFSATNGTDVWESSFGIKAYAPVIEIADMDIEEVEGNGNGRLDAGETALIQISIENKGRCASPAGLASILSESDYLTINAASFEFETIDSAGMITAEFNVTAADETPIGTVIHIDSDVAAGPYNFEKGFDFSVGLIVEDWESGDMSAYPWVTNGNANWQIDNTIFYEGNNSVRSGDIGDNQTSNLLLDYDVMVDNEISFFVKVSSESGYDYLQFYIDNTMVDEWAGEVNWTQVSYPVTAGQHTFKWVYDKDGSVSSGQDCGWIDFIVLPPMLVPSANAGDDAEICQSTQDSYELNGSAENYNSIEWLSSGDGSFSATDILNPVYTIGAEDISNGGVTLTLKAYGNNGDVINNMYLKIAGELEQTSMPEGETMVCYMAEEISYTIAENNDTYLFTLEPAEAGIVTVVGNTATISFAESFSGQASLTSSAYNACGESEASEALEITVLEQAHVSFMGDAETCFGSEASLEFELIGQGPWMVEMTDEEGAEMIFEATESPFTYQIMPEQNTTYSLVSVQDQYSCVGAAEGSAMVSVHELPTGILSTETNEICAGESFPVNLELSGASPWTISLGDVAGNSQEFEVFDAAGSVEFVAPTESFNIEVLSLSDANGCAGSGEGNASISVLAGPEVDLGMDTVICHNIVYTLDAGTDGNTYLWSTGAETQTIEVDQSMADENNMVYLSVDVTNENGCTTTDEVTVEYKDCTGIDELSVQDVQIKPNPNNGRFVLEINEKSISHLIIYNAVSEIVQEFTAAEMHETMNIDLSHLPAGVYFLNYSNEYSQVNKKFVISK